MFTFTRRSVCSLLAVLALTACSPDKPKFSSIDITGAEYAQDFTLTDHNDQRRSLSDFKGKVVVLFFGYTQCPDVCPTSMSELAEVKRLLGADGDKLQGVFVTVDPARDTTELLKAYMVNFDPTFVAFVPTPDELADVAKRFKIYYKKQEGKRPPATRWITQRAAMCMTHVAMCACTAAMVQGRRCWRKTFKPCSKPPPDSSVL